MNWIHSKSFDLTFILAPPFLVLLAFCFFPSLTSEGVELSTLGWALLVLGIDVSHVWSSLFRTYFHAQNRELHRTALTTIPIAVYIAGVLLYGMGPGIFWTVVAYVAVFHFMRQQYGFMRLYSSNQQTKKQQQIDSLTIHALCLYPIIYWHAHLPRQFHWMVSGDFLFGVPVWFERICFVLYMGLILSYVIKEVRTQAWNLPKNLIMLSTGLTWYVGIVALNGDITFTFTNVIAHGIPYMALVWAHEQKEFSRLKTWWGPVSFLLIIVALAYGEEVLWAGLVWREHFAVFEFARLLPAVKEIEFLTLLVPLLTVPQATHYILDGFIWKRQGRRL